jgi:hypothetical protein
MRTTLVAALMTAALLGCSKAPRANGSGCTQNADCAAGSYCAAGVCTPAPSGGALSAVGGAGRITAGTRTMDVVIGQPTNAAGSAGTKTMAPAENTR